MSLDTESSGFLGALLYVLLLLSLQSIAATSFVLESHSDFNGTVHCQQATQEATQEDVASLLQVQTAVSRRQKLDSRTAILGDEDERWGTLLGDVHMPRVALGCWPATVGSMGAHDAVRTFVQLGGRHLDLAASYLTNAKVAAAVKEMISEGVVTRGDLFITTKLTAFEVGGPTTFDQTLVDIKRIMHTLGTPYVDLLLIHSPCRLGSAMNGCTADSYAMQRAEVWQALEKTLQDGTARAIGVSNFDVPILQRLLDDTQRISNKRANISANQIQWHLGHHDDFLLQWCNARNIQVEAAAALGLGWPPPHFPAPPLDSPLLMQLADRHNVSTAQIALRWSVQQGVTVVTGSSNPAHLAEDLSLFSFNLSQSEMKALSGLQYLQEY